MEFKGLGAVKIRGTAAKTKGSAKRDRFNTKPIPKRESRVSERTTLKKRIYEGQAPEVVKFRKMINARVKMILTLTSIW